MTASNIFELFELIGYRDAPGADGEARAVARIVHSGKRSMVVQVEISSVPDDDLAVIATVSFAKILARG
ncbi:hypothetical protein H7J08_18525 [Mycobacterium frederiksbergense]|uniref:hotdog domain-containing protein n=1 Tax=Mycolicibacterium frederiksbergense TaxID=117567 RepID=UPI0021F376ED|nr:hotdog domain-containing protein [Mycolicibacterium frederiksbergense]MCV7046646.1 hypothetical protein [Mycolicibacterium frederiksbergense]